MNNEELKKKIENIVAMAILEAEELPFVETAEYVADALIAAKIGDVKDLQAQVDVLEITNIALQAGYDDAEKDRLYWVNKYKEAEHRAEVAEDMIDEFAEKVLEKIRYEYENYPNVMTVGKYYQLRKEINELADEMRQEVK